MRIDEMLARAGWVVQDYTSPNLHAATGVAIRELVTTAGPADYVLFVNRQVVGVIEAKKQGTTLAGVEWQTMKYQANVPDELPAVKSPSGHLPFGYESTGDETWFTSRFDPEPTSRRVFWFHTPETLADMVEDYVDNGDGSLRASLQHIEPLAAWTETPWLREAQHAAITNLEVSLKANKPRALIQMATGSGKTFAAANICQRLIVERWREADLVSRRPRQSRRADAQGVPGVRRAGHRPQVHRALQRAAPLVERDRPGRQSVHQHDPTCLFDPARRRDARW